MDNTKSNSYAILEVTFLGEGGYTDYGTIKHMSELAEQMAQRIDVVSCRIYGDFEGKPVDFVIDGDYSRIHTFDFEFIN